MNGWIIPLGAISTVLVVFFVSAIVKRLTAETPLTPLLRKITAFFFPYIRRTLYSFSLLWALWIYWSNASEIPAPQVALTTMMREFGLTALYLLFISLVPGLVRVYFPRFSLNPLLIHARRALGVSVFFFAAIHAGIGFFNNLSGSISSVFFLSGQNQLALLFSTIAFAIFSLMTITSFDKMVAFLGHARWKLLHRFVYPAAYLSVFHAFFIGSHFTTPSNTIPLLTNNVALTLVLLEVGATAKRFRQKAEIVSMKRWLLRWGVLFSVSVFALYTSATTFTKQYDPHAKHRRGYSKDYEVRVTTDPMEIVPKTPIDITLQVYDKRTQKQVQKFQIIQEKLMHVIVIRDDLETYDHIHPEQQADGSFLVTTQFPEEGNYRLYVEYSPPDFFENVTIVNVRTANGDEKRSDLSVGEFTKTFKDSYRVSLQPEGPFAVNENIDFVYSIADAATGQPVTDLEPYLAAFGHLAALHEDGETYSHVHPIDIPLTLSALGGPTVRFSTFFSKPGKYKLFCQFKHNGELFVTDFVVEVQ